MAPRTTADAVTRALDGVSFPADKSALIDGAEGNNADPDTVGALRSVQPNSYDGVADVLASVDITDEDAQSTEALRAPRRQNHTHSGLAEGEKGIGPVNPIADELGTNRKA